MLIVQEHFKCIYYLLTGETDKENCGWEILDVPRKHDHGVPGGHTLGKFRVYLV